MPNGIDLTKAYLDTSLQLIKAPRRFFTEADVRRQLLPPVAFLAISSIVSALSAMLLGPQPAGLLNGAVLAINGFGMALLAAGVAYPVALPLAGARISFGRIFSVFAHSSGVTLLIAWNPELVIIAEPWKWWLVWTGMRRRCGLNAARTALVLMLTVAMIIMLFQILVPLTANGFEI